MSSVYSVGQVNNYIKGLFKRDIFLRKISVRGEVSNCKYHHSGHIYFTLKDSDGVLACVMFASARRGLAFPMKDGDKVVVEGTIEVFERDGRYQLYARRIVREGAGVLYERYLRLKQELQEQGLFDKEHKKAIPSYASVVGVVTAPTGAAVRDIQNIAARRNPCTQLILFPAQVQGEGAALSIVQGIQMLDMLGVDVIIVGRGGGSIEDLWAFNEEIVARAIYECQTPIISAVGHETDFTIADEAADLRAPTPSAAAELAVSDLRAILQQKARLAQALQTAMEQKLLFKRRQLEVYSARWKYLSPEQRIRLLREKLDRMQERMTYLSPESRIREYRQLTADMESRLTERSFALVKEKRHRLQILIEKMQGLSPLERLNRGFAYVENEKGNPVRSVREIKAGDRLLLTMADGRIGAEVKEIKEPEA